MRCYNSLTALVLLSAVNVPCSAAILLELSNPTPLDCGLTSYIVSALGTEGEIIAGFDRVRLTGAHQVFRLGGDDTPSIDDVGGFGWNDAWTAYDSHLLIPRADILGQVGAPLAETNDGSTTGMVGLPRELGMVATSGRGTLASRDGTDGFRLLPALQKPRIEFLQVVIAHGHTAFVELAVAASLNGIPFIEHFSPITPATHADMGGTPTSMENCIIPEPMTACLIVLALAGLAGIRRPR
jgi:hypothetical protein